MKKVIVAVAVTIVAVLVLLTVGGYSLVVANNRKVPIYSVATDNRQVAISFDAAWGADKTLAILDLCDQYDIKVTFFLVGFWIDKYPDMVLEIDKRGHEIGTHTLTHPKMSTLSRENITKELQGSMEKITAITGKPVTLFRPPFGDYNNTLLEVADNLGLYTIQWSVDSLDWKGLSARAITERIQKSVNGDIILCHNNSDHIVEALPLIIASIKNKGLQFVPIGQLIYLDNYYIDNNGRQHINKVQ